MGSVKALGSRSGQRSWLTLAGVGLWVMGCAGSTGTSVLPTTVTQSIGPEGGSITIDGATVRFPAGAVAAATSITIAQSTEAAPTGHVALSKVYRCSPTGTTFAQPVSMTMAFTPDGTTPTMFWSTDNDVTFTDVGGNAAGSTFTATVTHFSGGFVGHK
jgi:hypothetical protein